LKPKSRAPWVWLGFLFAAAFLLAEGLYFIPDVDEESFQVLFLAIVIGASVYWLFCVHRFHKILKELSDSSYPITPSEAVGKHFIPILNLIWIFQWPTEMSDYLNQRGRVRMISGKLIGLLLLFSFLLRFVDGAVGLACTFGVGMYISAKLRRHVARVIESSGEMFPPPPDRDLFGYRDEPPADGSRMGSTEANQQV
jgi:hypothetical protein